MSGYVIGVDGGGSKTRAVVLGPDGAELARAEGRPAVADARTPAAAADSVTELCASVARAAGRDLPAHVLWAGLSGAGREAARAGVELELHRAGVASRVRVDTDVRAAFHDAFPVGPGVLLIAGTGSIAWGRGEDGREGRVGGWGPRIGDEGSGFAIAEEALRRIARSADGRGPGTTLRARVLGRLGLTRVEELVGWASQATRAHVAELAPLVVEAAIQGDGVAKEVVAGAVEELRRHAAAMLANLGPWATPPVLALAGGLIRRGGPLRSTLEAVVPTGYARVAERDPDAALGAARLALDLASRDAFPPSLSD